MVGLGPKKPPSRKGTGAYNCHTSERLLPRCPFPPLPSPPSPSSLLPISCLTHICLPSLSPGEVRIRPPTSLLTALEWQSRTCQQSNMALVLHLPASHVGGGWEGKIRRYRRNPLWANKRRSSDIFSIVSTSPPVPAFGSVKCVACRCSVCPSSLRA